MQREADKLRVKVSKAEGQLLQWPANGHNKELIILGWQAAMCVCTRKPHSLCPHFFDLSSVTPWTNEGSPKASVRNDTF